MSSDLPLKLEANDDHESLFIVTQIVQQLSLAYHRNPTLAHVAPHISCLQLWLQYELERQRQQNADELTATE